MLKKSIWGKGEKITLTVLKKEKLNGAWLDLAAGDGRYVTELLDKVDQLIVSDIDEKALEIISENYPNHPKLKIQIFDMTQKLPFVGKQFDGVFCVGTLHIFGAQQLKFIFSEIKRVLKPKGKIIIDFGADIKREYFGEVKKYKNLPEYTLDQAKKILRNLLPGYAMKMYQSNFYDDLRTDPEFPVSSKGKIILFLGQKSRSLLRE